VAGYYDPRSKTLYVVQGVDSATAAATLRHELVHALQDQHRNLDSLLRGRGHADRARAAHAALEGQATWTQVGGGADLASRVQGGWERVRTQIRDNADRAPGLSEAPLVVREGLLFPYLSGAELARAAALAGHPDSVLWRLPASTEQVLHAERYLGTEARAGARPARRPPGRRARGRHAATAAGRAGHGRETRSASSTRAWCSSSSSATWARPPARPRGGAATGGPSCAPRPARHSCG
jgi:hypothetical protein